MLVATVAPVTKLVPVRVTGTAPPVVPLAGLMELSVGAEALTVKITDGLVPPEVLTVTLAAPVEALEPIVNVAVI